jgi:SAM-dependent methyltransferase
MAHGKIRSALVIGRNTLDRFASMIGFRQSEAKIQNDAGRFWKDPTTKNHGVYSHWRGHGIFENDDPRWLSIGANHIELFQRLSKSSGVEIPNAPLILEWGCGGGANGVAFSQIAGQYVGVDISQESLEECVKQVKLSGHHEPIGQLVDIRSPESALSHVKPADILLCTYVFELLPTRAYALRLMQLFFELLKPGAVAFIQIRYASEKQSTRGRSWGYRFGPSKMVAFRIEEFWNACSQVGFVPKCITLFLIQKPSVVASISTRNV